MNGKLLTEAVQLGWQMCKDLGVAAEEWLSPDSTPGAARSLWRKTTDIDSALWKKTSAAENAESKALDLFEVSYPGSDTAHSNAFLAQLLEPRNPSSPFAGLHDLSVLTQSPNYVPAGRRATNLYFGNETPWLQSLQNRFNNGDIDGQTLLVTQTGHGAPIAYAMAQRFRSDIFMNYPKAQFAFEANVHRLTDQAQSFYSGINDALNSGERKGVSTMVSLDLHQEYPMSEALAKSFPAPSTLRAAGFRKVFVGTENPSRVAVTRPFTDITANSPNFSALQNWLHSANKHVPVVQGNLDLRFVHSRMLLDQW